MNIYKTKVFARWADKEGLSDQDLTDAIAEIDKGQVEASLGKLLYKKRVSRAGEGKSGGYRTIIAYRSGNKAFFLHGFDKGTKDNITGKEKKALQKLAGELFEYTAHAIQKAGNSGALIEVK